MSQLPVYGNLNERLQLFVTTFVKEFEAKLNFHYLLLKGEIKKEDMPESYTEKALGYAGAAVGAAGGIAGVAVLSTSVSSILQTIKFGRQFGKGGGQKLNSRINQEKRLKTATVLWSFIKLYTEDKIRLRQELIKAACEIFQSFEHQFRYVHNNREWMKGIKELARNSVHRAINYCVEQIEVDISNIKGFISKGTILGKSKYESSFTQLLLLFQIGSTELKWNSTSLYNKAGIIVNRNGTNSYFEKQDSRTTKYGYRRLLPQEKWPDLENDYEKSPQNLFQNYEYSLVGTTDEDVEKFLKEIEGEGLTEKRIKQVLQEVQTSIIRDIEALKELCSHNHKEDAEMLTRLASKLENINIENYLIEYREMNQQIQKSIDALHKEFEENQEEIKASTSVISKAMEEVELKLSRKFEPIRFNIQPPITGFEREELNRLIEVSRERIKNYSFTAIITGNAGMGKTELARQYIQKFAQNHYENIIWINGGNEVEIVNSFITLAMDVLKIAIQGEVIKVGSILTDVYKILWKKHTLLVFDHVEDTVTYKKFLKSASFGRKLHVLMTSRCEEWGEMAEEESILRLDELCQEDAKQLVTEKLKIRDGSHKEDIESLVQNLQNFPLCINVATDYIRNETECSIIDYLIKFVEKNLELYESESFLKWVGKDPYREIAYITLEIIIERIRSNEHYGAIALKILSVASYLAPENIRKISFLLSVKQDVEKLNKAIELLIKYSVIVNVNANENEECLSINRLFQDTVREIMKEEKSEIARLTLKIFCDVYPLDHRNVYNTRVVCEALPHYESLFEHIKSQCAEPRELKTLMDSLISFPDFLDALTTAASVGYCHIGNDKRLKEVLHEILNIKEKCYGSDDFELANTLINLASAYARLGENEKQKQFAEKALNLEKERYGEDSYEVVNAMKNLSVAYRGLGDTENEVKLLEEVVTILKKKHGSNHPEVIKLTSVLGTAYGKLDKRDKQKELLEETLQIAEVKYGKNAYVLIGILVDLGDAYGRLKEFEKEKELLNRALRILQKTKNSKNPANDANEVVILVNLASIRLNSKEYEEAKDLLEKALEIQERQYDPEHYELEVILNNLAIAYRELKYLEAGGKIINRLEVIKKKWPQRKFRYCKNL